VLNIADLIISTASALITIASELAIQLDHIGEEQSRRITKESDAKACPSQSQDPQGSEGGRPNKSPIGREEFSNWTNQHLNRPLPGAFLRWLLAGNSE
jgi:hypothetical protein